MSAPLNLRYVTIEAFTASGYTVKAMQQKIHKGVWMEGREYRRGPDGRILIDMIGFVKWVEKGPA